MLHGRSGIGFSGANPLQYGTIMDWNKAMDVGGLEPYEIEALLFLDGAFSDANDEETNQDDEVNLPKEQPPWPERKE